VSEQFITPDFLPPTTHGSSELEVKITEKTGVKLVSRTLDVSYKICGFIMLPFDLKCCRKWENDSFVSFLLK